MSANSSTVARVFGLVIVLVLGCSIAIETPAVQKRFADYAISRLNRTFSAEISFSSIRLKPFTMFEVSDLLIKDRDPYIADDYGRGWEPSDTVIYAGTARGTINPFGLLRGEGIHLGRVFLDDVRLNITKEPEREVSCNLSRIFSGKNEKSDSGINLIDITDMNVKRLSVTYRNYNEPSGNRRDRIRFDDVHTRSERLRAYGFRLSNGIASAVVEHLDIREHSGYILHDIQGKLRVGGGRTVIRKLHIKDPWSDFRAKEYSMTYGSSSDFNDFTNNVRLKLTTDDGVLGMMTIHYFSGILPRTTMRLALKDGAVFKGYVNDFQLDDFRFRDIASGVSGEVSGKVSGIPDSEYSGSVSVGNLTFTGRRTAVFINQLDSLLHIKTGPLAPDISYSLNARANGRMNRLDVTGRLYSNAGKASVDINIRNLTDRLRPLEIRGGFSTDRLDLGRVLNIGKLGECSLSGGARAFVEKGNPSVILDSLNIDGLQAFGYDYTGINASGRIHDGVYDGCVTVDDPNATITLQGVAGLNPEKYGTPYNLTVCADKVNLKALFSGHRHSSITGLKGTLNADLVTTGGKWIDGQISINDFVAVADSSEHRLGEVFFVSETEGGINRTIMETPILDCEYEGSIMPVDLMESIQTRTTKRHLKSIYKSDRREFRTSGGECTASVRFRNSEAVLPLLIPGLNIAESTTLTLSMDEEDIGVRLFSPRISWKNTMLRNSFVNIANSDNRLIADIGCTRLKKGKYRLGDTGINLTARNDSLSLSLHSSDCDNPENSADINAGAAFFRDQEDIFEADITVLPSRVRYEENEWSSGDCGIRIKPGELEFKNFLIENGSQCILLAGAAKENGQDTLTLSLRNKSMAFIGLLTDKVSGLSGNLNGEATLFSPLSEGIKLTSDISCEGMAFRSEDLGDVHLLSLWNDTEKSLELSLENTVNDRNSLSARGFFKPREKNIGADVVFNRFKLATASPFLNKLFSSIGGYLNGELSIGGSKDAPVISGKDLYIEDAGFKLVSTGVSYGFSAPVQVNADGLRITGTQIRDDSGNPGSLDAELTWNRLRDLRLNASLKAPKLELINKADGKNEKFYGHLFADADVRVQGTVNDLLVSGNVSTTGEGNLNVKTGQAEARKESTLLTFRRPVDEDDFFDTSLSTTADPGKDKGNVRLDLNVSVINSTNAEIEIDKSSGNVVTAYGNGNVRMEMASLSASPAITGEYNIEGGKYRFSIPGMIGRDFNISSGSSLKFRGDIKNTEIDLTAIYNLKTSIGPLIADTSSVSNRRNVECIIHITGQIQNMKMGFDINIPDLDPTTKTRVDGALNTDDKIQQQFIGLLVTGSFLPGELGGVFNSSNILYSNVGDIMASQLNRILQQLEIPVDLGLEYQQDGSGTDLFDVAVSTKLFNNRVDINGSVGNRKYSNSAAGDVVGDIDIEYKIDPAGQFRLKMFSHSADEFTSFLDYSQRNGMGIAYQKGFDNFFELIRYTFASKRKRAEMNAAREERKREMKTTSIEDE